MNPYFHLISDTSKFQGLKFRNSYIAKIDGDCCRTSNDLYQELKKCFELPDYFGKNLDALYDCLMDLEWITQDHIQFVIQNFDSLLSDEVNDPELIEDFILTLNDVCQSWDLLDSEEFTPKTMHVYFIHSDKVKEILKLNEIAFDKT